MDISDVHAQLRQAKAELVAAREERDKWMAVALELGEAMLVDMSNWLKEFNERQRNTQQVR